MHLAELVAMRDALERARYAGIRKVEYANGVTVYASDNEMRAALADLNRRIAQLRGRRSGVINTTSSKGL